MSNTEAHPAERVCASEPPPPGATPAGAPPLEMLPPREVPLGGPRAMRVRRVLPQRDRSLVGAWCFLDSYGPEDVAGAGGMRVARHPHTGLATVSWLFEGRIDHLDSAGNWATVRPGEVHLMNAGAGITHQEFSTADTGVLHGVQLWYAFPERARFSEPSLASHRPEPVLGPGYAALVFAGSLLGASSPVRTHLPLTGAELRLEPGARLDVEVPADHEHGVLLVEGAVDLDGEPVPPGHLAYAGLGRRSLRLAAGEAPARLLLIGGEPLGERIVMWWNFVGRSHEEIAAWRAAYQAEMGFEAPGDDSPLTTDAALGAPPAGDALDALLGARYDDGRRFPQFGTFPPGQPDPLPAPALPTVRMRPRG